MVINLVWPGMTRESLHAWNIEFSTFNQLYIIIAGVIGFDVPDMDVFCHLTFIHTPVKIVILLY
jgi:hypothetical protein